MGMSIRIQVLFEIEKCLKCNFPVYKGLFLKWFLAGIKRSFRVINLSSLANVL